MQVVARSVGSPDRLLVQLEVVSETLGLVGVVEDLFELVDIVVVDIHGRVVVNLLVIVAKLVIGFGLVLLSLSHLLCEVTILDILCLFLDRCQTRVFLLSVSFQVLLCIGFGIGLSKHRNSSLESKCLRFMREHSLEVPFTVPILDEVNHTVDNSGGACLGIPEIEGVEVEHVAGRGLSFEGFKDTSRLLVQSFPEDIIEEEGFDKLDRVLHQLLTVLFIQEAIENPQICHISLVSVARVCETRKSLQEEMFGWEGRASAFSSVVHEDKLDKLVEFANDLLSELVGQGAALLGYQLGHLGVLLDEPVDEPLDIFSRPSALSQVLLFVIDNL